MLDGWMKRAKGRLRESVEQFKDRVRESAANRSMTPEQRAERRKQCRARLAEHFADPLAGEVEWHGMMRSSSQLRSHRLGSVRGDRAKVGAALWFLAFGVVLTLTPITASIWLLRVTPLDVWFASQLLFVPWAIIGIVLLRSTRAMVFCRRSGRFWRNGEPGNHRGSLSSIHALQIVPVQQRASEAGESDWTAYELVIVLGGGARVPVMQHGGLYSLRADAQRLAEFLGVPIWDAATNAIELP